MRYPLLLLLVAPLAVAQPADGILDGPHDYSRTMYTAEAAFVYAQPGEGRVVEMVPVGAIAGAADAEDQGKRPCQAYHPADD